MKKRLKGKEQRHQRRHLRIRKRVKGTAERPRILVRKSLKHLYVVVVDDSPAQGSYTLATATTNRKGVERGKGYCNVENGKKLGAEVAKALQEKGVTAAVFDRGGYPYHGVVRAVAESAREAGLTI